MNKFGIYLKYPLTAWFYNNSEFENENELYFCDIQITYFFEHLSPYLTRLFCNIPRGLLQSPYILCNEVWGSGSYDAVFGTDLWISIASIHINQTKQHQFSIDLSMTSYTSKR